jgi:membrane fusion protein, multidrug efflux system
MGDTKEMNKTRPYCQLFCFLLVGCSLVFVTGCKKKEVRMEKITNVSIQAAAKKQFRPFIEATGTLNPFEEVSIGAEIDGIVKSVKADEGTAVSRGMLLATIDDIEYSQGVLSAQAALKQAEASLANAKVEFSRKDALYKEELVTKQQYDDVSTRLALAESDVEKVRAALSIAKQKLAKTRIYAPLSSRVKEKLVSEGDFVKNGTRLFTLIQPNPLKLRFFVSERDVGRMKVGQDVSVKVDAFSDKEFKGKVSIVFPSLDEKTRTLSIEALVPDKEGMLKPGLFARVISYTGGMKDTIVVPNTALLYEGDQIRTYVIEGDRAKERLVKLGNKYGDEIEILEGIKEGDKVVTAGQQGLSEGAKVNYQGAQRKDAKTRPDGKTKSPR